MTIERLTGPSAVAQSALGRDFSNWDFTSDSSQSWTGALNIEAYEAIDFSGLRGPSVMGAHLEATYTAPITECTPRFRWMQIILTNDPATGRSSPYVDGFTNDGRPFYYDEPLIYQNRFEDWPSRECPSLGITSWQAELYLVDWYLLAGDFEDNNVRIYEGIRWGFEIDCPASLVTGPEGDQKDLDIDVQTPPVPAPGAGLLALMGIGLGFWSRRWIGWRAA